MCFMLLLQCRREKEISRLAEAADRNISCKTINKEGKTLISSEQEIT